MPNINVRKFSRSKAIDDIVENELENDKGVHQMEDCEEDHKYDHDDDNIDYRELFADLKSDNFTPKVDIEKQKKEQDKLKKEEEKVRKEMEKQQRQYEKQCEKERKAMEKEQKKATTKKKTDPLFSDDGTELYGKDRLVLIAKINQYKALFPENKRLQQLKIKNGATLELLEDYIKEIEAYVETDVVESFLTDSILQCIKMLELPSTKTRYDITGLSDMLRKNKQYNQLAKQLYIKYKVFSSVPVEAQMMMLIATSTYVCIESNKKKKDNNIDLNKSVDIDDFEDLPPL